MPANKKEEHGIEIKFMLQRVSGGNNFGTLFCTDPCIGKSH